MESGKNPVTQQRANPAVTRPLAEFIQSGAEGLGVTAGGVHGAPMKSGPRPIIITFEANGLRQARREEYQCLMP